LQYFIDKWYIILNFIYTFENIPRRLLNILIIKYIVDAASSGGEFKKILFYGILFLLAEIMLIIIKHVFLHVYKQPHEEIIRTNLKRKMMLHSLEFDVSCFDNTEFFNLYTKAYSSLDVVAFNVLNTLISLLGAILSVLTLTSYIFIIDPLIIVVSLLGSAISIFANSLISKLTYSKKEEQILPTRKCSYATSKFFSKANSKDLRVEKISHLLLELFNESSTEKINIVKKYEKKIAGLKVVFDAPLDISDMFMWLYIAFGIIKGFFKAGDFMSLSNAVWSLSQQIRNVFNAIPQLYENSLHTEDMLKFDTYKPTILSGYKKIENRKHCLEFDNVNFEYISGQNILKNISFKVETGESLAIVGHNGAGKSTIIKLALRLYDSLNGNIILDRIPYQEYDLESLRNQFSVVFQDYQYYAFSIAENILMHKPNSLYEEKIVIDALKKVGLYEKVSSFENGINTVLTTEFDKDGQEFSGGEYQKLAIARALVKNTPIIIMDEPSSALDPLAEKELSDLINRSFKDKIVIIISHKLSMTKNASNIILLDDGKIVESGSHRSLLEKNGIYAKMWKAQSDKYTEEGL